MRTTLDTPKPTGKTPVSTKRPVSKPRSGAAVQGVGSLVDAFIQAPPSPAAAGRLAPGPLIERLKEGLPIQELEHLGTHLDMSMEKLAPLLGISKATLHRRKLAGRLDTAESDRLVRYAQLLGRAAAVMESLEAGRRWLSSPQRGLGGVIPLSYALTEVGSREVENLLGRIEYGVYS